MLLAADSPVFFPPWYFWLFVFAMVAVIFTAISAMAICIKRAEFAQKTQEREIAARMVERMLDEHFTAAEIEQVLCGYQQHFVWSWLRRKFQPVASPEIPPAKRHPAADQRSVA